MQRKHRKVLLLLERSRQYGRGLMRGVLNYSALNGPWQFAWHEPFYLQPPRRSGGVEPSVPHVDGIIMREQHDNTPYLNAGVPVIFAGCLKKTDPDICRIETHDAAIVRLAAEHLLGRGLTRFAYFGYDTMYWSEERKKSFCAVTEQHGCSCAIFRQGTTQRQRQWSHEQQLAAEWLRSLPKPVGLLACNDDRASQAIDACRLANVNVPDEVAIVGIDNDEFVCESALPPLSSVSLSLELAGYHAAAVLDAMMGGQFNSPQQIFVEPTHVVSRHSSEILSISDPVVRDAVRFIREHSRRPLQVDDVLQHVAVSRRGLYGRFKSVLACSIHEYIKQVRIEQIQKLLLETDWPISHIARVMGFSSPDHIAAYFRSKTGINPHKYRLIHKLK